MSFTNFDKSILTLPLDGANGATSITDWSLTPKTFTFFGNAQISTAQSLFYGSSLLLDGTGDYVTSPFSSGYDPGAGDYSISVYIRPTNITSLRAIIGTYYFVSPNTYGWILYISSTGEVFFTLRDSASNFYNASSTGISLTINAWSHIAVYKIGTTYYLYLQGVNVGSVTPTNPVFLHQNSKFIIGRWDNDSTTTRDFIGNIQDILLVKGVALETSNFTPPGRLIGEVSNAATTSVLDSTGTPMQAPVHSIPITNNAPSRSFSTICDASGNFTLRAPSTESDIIIENIEAPTIYENKIVSKVLPI